MTNTLELERNESENYSRLQGISAFFQAEVLSLRACLSNNQFEDGVKTKIGIITNNM